MGEKQKPAYWAVLPSSVRYDRDVPPSARLLYAEISALIGADGYCYASNEYLAGVFDISVRTVQRLISLLDEKDYIAVEVIRDEHTNEVKLRKIYAGINPLAKAPPPDKNDRRGPDKNVMTSRQNCRPIIMNNNIILPDNPLKPPKGGKREYKEQADHEPKRFEGFWDFYPHNKRGGRQRAIQAWDKLKPDDNTIAAIGRGLERYMATDEWQRGIGIPHAATFLNQRRWLEAKDLTPARDSTPGGWAPDEEVI